METILTIINSSLIYLLSNYYLYVKGYDCKLSFLLVFLCFIVINVFPALFLKKIESKKLINIRKGYRLLEVFLISSTLSFFIDIASIFVYGIGAKIMIINILLTILFESIIFWNGMIRLYVSSTQLGIRYRGLGIVFGLVPIINLVMLIKIIMICEKEVSYESKKLMLNKERVEKQICKTKYPLLLIHGVFFRDREILNYWGRIPEELEKNGATIYYGNHQSASSVVDAAMEIKNRVLEIIEKYHCEKVNIIAHSKGGLDSRYAISKLGLDKYVASLVMVNTPNEGCEFADYLLEKASEGLKNRVANLYNDASKKLGDENPDFLSAVRDLTSDRVKELNQMMPKADNVYYKSFGSRLKKASGGRFPLNLTVNFVKLFDGYNDGLVGEKSFKYGDDYTFLESTTMKGISHGDIIDLNRENYDGFDVREFYVQLVNELREKGF